MDKNEKMLRDALKEVGFEIVELNSKHGSDTVLQGSACQVPVYGFVDAWDLTSSLYVGGEWKDGVWEDGQYQEGNFLVCREPGTGNVVQHFDLSAFGKSPAAVALGSIKSKAKAKASRENGKKGGRPRKKDGTK